jgi:hypothetical protein
LLSLPFSRFSYWLTSFTNIHICCVQTSIKVSSLSVEYLISNIFLCSISIWF